MFAGMALGLIGSVVQAGAAASAADAQSNAALYQAEVAKNNQKIAEQNASTTVTAGMEEAGHKGLETRALIGTEKVAQAASGIDVTSGSAAKVRQSTYLLGRMDEMTIMRSATKKADAYMAQAMNYQAEAGLYQYQAETAQTAKNYAIMSSLISGASSFAKQWSGASLSGMSGFGGFGGTA